jgi:hypothetical protein
MVAVAVVDVIMPAVLRRPSIWVGLGRVLRGERRVLRRLHRDGRAGRDARHDQVHAGVGELLVVDLVGEDAAVAGQVRDQADEVLRRHDAAEAGGRDRAVLDLHLVGVAVDPLRRGRVVADLGRVQVGDERPLVLVVPFVRERLVADADARRAALAAGLGQRLDTDWRPLRTSAANPHG